MITEALSGRYFSFVSGLGLMELNMLVVHAGFTLSSSPILRVDLSSTLQLTTLLELVLKEYYSQNIS